jgi:hypothetical protein
MRHWMWSVVMAVSGMLLGIFLTLVLAAWVYFATCWRLGL